MTNAATATNPIPRPVPPTLWGKDHWSTFGYADCRCVDNEGRPEKQHMRCDNKRHIAHSHMGGCGSRYPTILKGGVELPNHDDWDCIEDLAHFGLLEDIGTGLYPIWKMTAKGSIIAGKLRAHKAANGSFGNFEPGDI